MPAVEPIPISERPAVLGVLGAAFAGHPMLPADASPQKQQWRARLMVASMLDAFAGAPDHHWFGIRRDGELACCAFVFEYGYDPPWWAVPRMFWRMARIVGLRRCITYGRLMSQKRPGDDRRLELLILGTHPEHQAQGLGRAMMEHLYAWAQQRGYAAVVLEAAKHTPAFGFYEREGFVVEKEVPLPEMPLVFMRRELG